MKEKVRALQLETPLQLPVPLAKFVRAIGINSVTAWRWRQNGTLKVINIYGRLYVPWDELQRFLERAKAGEFKRQTNLPPRRAA